MKTTTHTLRKLKGQRPIVCVTAYDAITARFASEAGVDVILIGDSVGNTALGYENTVPVTLDDMCHHTAAVARAKPESMVAADVPFAEAHYDFERVLRACQRLMQEAGAEAVKIEGGAVLAPTVARLVEAGVPVWGHIGLKPQQVHALGRYKKFGTTPAEAEGLMADALALEKAGVFALLIEMVDHGLARTLSETVKVPVIGIGAGPHCDGQILVYTDMLGLSGGYVPGFARKFADAGEQFKKGFSAYADAVRHRKFPETETK
ncbi:MAG: 3-methyl-2-oxobutanoate hydroxymethyltransferase [Nibricoccus sp.]